MNVVRYIFLLGLVGALTGCVTPEEMGYLATPEPTYTTPVTPVYSTTPVYNTSPSYYATPVSGYSTMTVYDGYHPGYGGPHYPHHGPPSHGNRPAVHGGHGGPSGHHGGRAPAVRNVGSRPGAHGREQIRATKNQSAAQKPLPGKARPANGAPWRSGASGKNGASGKGGAHGKGGARRRK